MKPFLKSSYEGYICIDHTDSPGFDVETARAGGRNSLLPYLSKGQKFQAATNTCSHCEKVVVQNPDRTRPRGHCSKCDRFLCDPCFSNFYLNSQCRCQAIRFDAHMKGIV